MNVAIGSAFRNCAGIVSRWQHQVEMLQEHLGPLHLLMIWGDCIDGTLQRLMQAASDLRPASAQFVERSHGGPVFHSTENPDRMKALSFVGNGILESVDDDIDVLIYVESDLVWDPKTMVHLIDRLRFPDVDMVSPLIFAGDLFYDVWGHRGLDERRLSPFHPHHPDVKFDGALTPMSSVGSCLVMRGEVARRCRIIEDNALVGFCKDVRTKGFHIWLDATQKVRHL
jgi:hypothetical protein